MREKCAKTVANVVKNLIIKFESNPITQLKDASTYKNVYQNSQNSLINNKNNNLAIQLIATEKMTIPTNFNRKLQNDKLN